MATISRHSRLSELLDAFPISALSRYTESNAEDTGSDLCRVKLCALPEGQQYIDHWYRHRIQLIHLIKHSCCRDEGGCRSIKYAFKPARQSTSPCSLDHGVRIHERLIDGLSVSWVATNQPTRMIHFAVRKPGRSRVKGFKPYC